MTGMGRLRSVLGFGHRDFAKVAICAFPTPGDRRLAADCVEKLRTLKIASKIWNFVPASDVLSNRV